MSGYPRGGLLGSALIWFLLLAFVLIHPIAARAEDEVRARISLKAEFRDVLLATKNIGVSDFSENVRNIEPSLRINHGIVSNCPMVTLGSPYRQRRSGSQNLLAREEVTNETFSETLRDLPENLGIVTFDSLPGILGKFKIDDTQIEGGSLSTISEHNIQTAKGKYVSIWTERSPYGGKFWDANPSSLIQLHGFLLLRQLSLQDFELLSSGDSGSGGLSSCLFGGSVHVSSLSIHLPPLVVDKIPSDTSRKKGEDRYSNTNISEEHRSFFKSAKFFIPLHINIKWILAIASMAISVFLFKVGADLALLAGWNGMIDSWHFRSFRRRLSDRERILISLLCIFLCVAACLYTLHALIIVPHNSIDIQ